MVELLDLINVGPEEGYLAPMDLQQVISWKKGYPNSGGPFKFVNLDDEAILQFIEGDGLYATTDDGSSGQMGRVLVDDYHSFVGMIVETDLDPVLLEDTWAICDGTNGTPDLRGKFTLTVGPGFGAGTSGGATSFNNNHRHTMAHTHEHDHDAGSLVAESHRHGAGTYENGAHQHGAGTIAVGSHFHTGNTLSLPHQHSHSHEFEINVNLAAKLTGDVDDAGGGGDPALDTTVSLTHGGTDKVAGEAHRHQFDVDAINVIDDTEVVGTAITSTGAATGQTSTDGAGLASGSTGFDVAAGITGQSGFYAPSISGSTTNDATAAFPTNTGFEGSATQSIMPPYYVLYRVKRIA